MSYLADLSRWKSEYVLGESLFAVGWLDGEHSYSRGPVGLEFADRLAELLINPWQPVSTGGRHGCTFCRLSGGPARFESRAGACLLGGNDLFVPSGGRIYVAPSMVIHYIDAHEYGPPSEFQDAVLACPPMRSMAYLKALRSGGMHIS